MSGKSEFAHINYADWQVGAVYERMIKGDVVLLGRLVGKNLSGRTYDPKFVLTFELADGTQWQHLMQFDASYRIKC